MHYGFLRAHCALAVKGVYVRLQRILNSTYRTVLSKKPTNLIRSIGRGSNLITLKEDWLTQPGPTRRLRQPDLILVADRQLQLFQPFHLRHAVPGCCCIACFIFSQKAASFLSVPSLRGFFIPGSPPFPLDSFFHSIKETALSLAAHIPKYYGLSH